MSGPKDESPPGARAASGDGGRSPGTLDRGLADIMRRATDGVLLADAQAHITYANPVCERLWGRPLDSMVGCRPDEAIECAGASELTAKLCEAARSKRESRCELQCTAHQGGVITVDLRLFPMVEESGNVTGVAAILRDVTGNEELVGQLRRHKDELERVVREQASRLRSSEAMCRAFVETTAEMMLSVDGEGNVTYVNQAQCDALGYAQDELLGKNVRAFVDESRYEALSRHLATLHHEKRVFIPDALWKRKDGTRLHCEVNAVADVDVNGRMRGAYVVARDVTERKRMEEALRSSEDLQRTVLDQMQEAVVFADEQGVIRHINAFACDYLNTTREKAVGRDLLRFHSPEIRPKIREIIDKFESDPSAQVVSRQRPLGDRELIFRFSAMRDAEGAYRGVIANLIDVTEIKRLETRLEQVQRMESIGRLAGGIAHDLNNMMVTVTGLASYLQKRLGPDHADVERLKEIEEAGMRASDLVGQLVTYARTGKHRPQRVSLNDIVRNVMPMCEAGLAGRMAVRVELDPELPDVHADAIQMEHVFMNLCLNAAEAATGEGQLTISTSTDVLADGFREVHPELVDEPLVCLTVKDDGCGMDEAMVARAFEPYFSTKEMAQGLGLATVHGIVRNHGGHVQLDSRPGQGTVVRVFFPAYGES